MAVSAAPAPRFRFGLAGTWSYAGHAQGEFGQRVTAFYGPPRYRDFQAKAELDLSPQRHLTVLAMGATEHVQPSDDLFYYNNRWYPPHDRTWYRVALRYTNSGTLVMPFVGWTNDDLNPDVFPPCQPWYLSTRTQGDISTWRREWGHSCLGLTLACEGKWRLKFLCSVELALVHGKQEFDRRDDVKMREAQREIDRASWRSWRSKALAASSTPAPLASSGTQRESARSRASERRPPPRRSTNLP